ncbi:prolyl oligopeptidase family serine peptidase, partial [Candidatus Nomurabacteria bacterium]|nr:prolyl oligopeptidase family serine peptidase [Candidatus Nomurabacteria bacterium]
ANYGTTDFTNAGSERIQNGIEAMEYMYQRANTYKVDINKKIFVGGTSFGGIMASLLGTATNTEEFASVLHANIGGVLDFFGSVELPTDDEKSQLAFSTVFGCEDPLMCPEADIMRVAKYIDKDDPAFYIVHGQNDGTSRVEQSINLASSLSNVGVENKLTIDQELGHDSALVTKYIDSLIDFLRNHE